MTARSLRSRVREEMTEEIKRVARRHLATQGADLSLRAVARDLDIVASALYRYFPNRDALLTALILEAYESLAQAAVTADAAVDRADSRGRWYAVWRGVRAWALAHPAEYGLLYGTPVPGYSAPADTVTPAAAVVLSLVRVVVDADLGPAPVSTPMTEPLRADLRRLIDEQPGDLDERRLALVFAGWTQLFGLVGFEVFGRLDQTVTAVSDYFDHQAALMADLVGLPG
ncbi:MULTISPECIES: TetR/AcrR family transcriptional regulator [unclassified Nocardia]|uniref:TetR/AcrR family transcriptional regulator n=1 Tax=unclassified Nocardia TaxID=2637762 RepID=UPI00339E2939